MKKKLLLLSLLSVLLFSQSTAAHPGRTDSNGGHYDRSTGEYHYHTGEYAGRVSSGSSDSSAENKIEKPVKENKAKTAPTAQKPKENTAHTKNKIAHFLSPFKECIIFFFVVAVFCLIFIILFKGCLGAVCRFISYQKNSKRLLTVCRNLIEEYEASRNSSSDDLIQAIKPQIYADREYISNWDNIVVDYEKIAHSLLANTTFDLLASGKYHLYYGMLNPMSCAQNMKLIHKKSIEWALEHGYISEEDAIEDEKYLCYCIGQVG